MNTYDLLERLQWPNAFRDNKGTLTFSKVLADIDDLDNGSVTNATVIVSQDKVQLKVRTQSLQDTTATPLMEAQWDIVNDQSHLTLFVQRGQQMELFDDQAIEAFQDDVNALGVRPKFQSFALRQPKTPQQTSFKFEV